MAVITILLLRLELVACSPYSIFSRDLDDEGIIIIVNDMTAGSCSNDTCTPAWWIKNKKHNILWNLLLVRFLIISISMSACFCGHYYDIECNFNIHGAGHLLRYFLLTFPYLSTYDFFFLLVFYDSCLIGALEFVMEQSNEVSTCSEAELASLSWVLWSADSWISLILCYYVLRRCYLAPIIKNIGFSLLLIKLMKF